MWVNSNCLLTNPWKVFGYTLFFCFSRSIWLFYERILYMIFLKYTKSLVEIKHIPDLRQVIKHTVIRVCFIHSVRNVLESQGNNVEKTFSSLCKNVFEKINSKALQNLANLAASVWIGKIFLYGEVLGLEWEEPQFTWMTLGDRCL